MFVDEVVVNYKICVPWVVKEDVLSDRKLAVNGRVERYVDGYLAGGC